MRYGAIFSLLWALTCFYQSSAVATDETSIYVRAQPYEFPYDGKLAPQNTALLIIDMQRDFCCQGGYVDKMGYDISLTRKAIDPIKTLLTLAREAGLTIVHTREGHRPDLSDLPENKRWRSKQMGAEIGSAGPMGRILVRGEPGWQIIDELTPLSGEVIIDKPGKGSLCATDLELILENKGIANVILTGVTTDVCVHTTMRELNDRGYECLILDDCTAATDPNNHRAALEMVKKQGGVFGCVSVSQSVIEDFFNPIKKSATKS